MLVAGDSAASRRPEDSLDLVKKVLTHHATWAFGGR